MDNDIIWSRRMSLDSLSRKNSVDSSGFIPRLAIAGNSEEGSTYRSPVAVLEKCVTQLGLKPHSVIDAIRDNADSLLSGVW